MFSAGFDKAKILVWPLALLLVWQSAGRAGDLPGVKLLPAALPRCCPPLEERGALLLVRGRERPPSRRHGEEEEKKRFRSRLYLSAALAAASGLVAWWSKERADRAYERYLHAASLRRQEDQFARAERYDRIAGGAFVGMEIGVVLTTYLLFF